MKIFSFDPGVTTGYCVIEVQNGGQSFEVRKCGEIGWEFRFDEIYNVMFTVAETDHIVVESFRIFPHKAMAQIGSDVPSVRVIGNIESFHYTLQIRQPIGFQTPGDIARVAVEEQDIQWVASSPHKIDAYRHAKLYYIKHIRLNPFNQLVNA